MNKLRLPLIATGVVLALGLGAWAQSVKMIANPNLKLDSISASELRSVFLKERKSLGGSHVEPVLARSGPAHDAFLRLYLGRTDDDLQTYYRSLVFTGRGSMPKVLESDTEIIAYVAKTRGAIGYVSPEAGSDGVRTLAVVSDNSSERTLISRVEPDYPEVLRSHSIGGTVRLRLTVAPAGIVESVEVLGGDAALGEAAAAAAVQWRYSPKSSQSLIEVLITFDPSR
ncbi:MAG: TonB family protein [Terriglobales bacterium]|jgi:TonB family protein